MIPETGYLFAMKRLTTRIRLILPIRSIFLVCALAASAAYSYADVTITVISGSTSTCLDSLYNQILVPAGWVVAQTPI